MKTLIIALLLQSYPMVPRNLVESPASVSPVPKNLQRDYDKLWVRFVKGTEDVKIVKDAEKLMKKNPGFFQLVMIEAYIDLYNNRVHDGEVKLKRVLRVEPRNRLVLSYLAEFAFAREDYATAGDLYSRLIEVDPSRTDVETKRQKALLLATEDLIRGASKAELENRPAEAESFYIHALQMAPQDSSLHGRLGDLYAKQKKYDKAIEEFKKERQLGGAADDVDRRTAEVLMHQGRTDEARELLENLKKSGTADAGLDAKLGELEDIGRWGVDIDVFRTIKAEAALMREQLAALIVRYFPQLSEGRRTSQVVTDIQDSWARPEIQIVIGIGLIDPFPNHSFQPRAPITRGELAKVLAGLTRLLRIPPTSAPPIPIADVGSSNVLYQEIQSVVGYGLMSVDEEGSFNVNATVSGENAVGAVGRLLALSRQVAQ